MNDAKLNEFVQRARNAVGENLLSMILFGSAASGDYESGFSDFNVLCVVRDASPSALQALSGTARWWATQKQPPPLVMTRSELERTTDVFTIELLDMQKHHRVLFGEDVVKTLQVPLHLHRVQVEYELREKIVLLRRQYLLAAEKDRAVWDLMLHSVPSFITLFRHALIALGQPATTTRREAVESLGQLLGFDSSVMLSLLEVRQNKTKRDTFDARDLFARYVAAIEKVTDAVDNAGSMKS